jgi:glycerol-3-phosphate dehydrogenase
MFQQPLPQRVRVLILGGGIHGAGILHDLASRGWQDVHLLEKKHLGHGTSSRSTKLIHGGLRYLQRIHDFPLVAEALRERRILMEVAADLVHPLEFVFPVLRSGGASWLKIKTGLALYDFLAGKSNVGHHRQISESVALDLAPAIDPSKFTRYFSFWDCQTDDLALVRRAAWSAVKMGAGVSEGHKAVRIAKAGDGWNVDVCRPDGSIVTVSCLYLVNALGPWANHLLDASGIHPTHEAINNKGSHLVFPDIGLKAGLFLQSPEDNRIFFVLPWLGKTLIGTTETAFSGDVDDMRVSSDEISYLLARCNRYLKRPLREQEIEASFAGLRWLACEKGHSISSTSRSHLVGKISSGRGALFTLYGGKLSTYRALSEEIGTIIARGFGDETASRTRDPACWFHPPGVETSGLDVLSRFDR